MQMGYDFENDLLAAEASARLRPRFDGPEGSAARLHPAAERPVHDEQSGQDDAGDGPVLRQPDWTGLRARFAAIHSLHKALAAETAAAVVTGSFADAGESVLSSCRKGTAINPVYWVNIKGPCAITGSVAAAPTRGDRGLA